MRRNRQMPGFGHRRDLARPGNVVAARRFGCHVEGSDLHGRDTFFQQGQRKFVSPVLEAVQIIAAFVTARIMVGRGLAGRRLDVFPSGSGVAGADFAAGEAAQQLRNGLVGGSDFQPFLRTIRRPAGHARFHQTAPPSGRRLFAPHFTMSAQHPAENPQEGALFSVDAGVAGMNAHRFGEQLKPGADQAPEARTSGGRRYELRQATAKVACRPCRWLSRDRQSHQRCGPRRGDGPHGRRRYRPQPQPPLQRRQEERRTGSH